MLSLLVAVASLSAPTPFGPVVLMDRWQPRYEVLALLPGGQAQAYRIAASLQSSRSWFTFAAAWDTGGVWQRHHTIVVTTDDGRELEADRVMAMTPRPQCAPIFLGSLNRTLHPDDCEVGRSKKGIVGIVILASFLDPKLSIKQIADVQIRKVAPPPSAAQEKAQFGGSP